MKVIGFVFCSERMRRTRRTIQRGRQKLIPIRFVNCSHQLAWLVLIFCWNYSVICTPLATLLNHKTRSNIVFVYLTEFVFCFSDNLLFLVSSFSVSPLLTFTSGRIYPECKTEVLQPLPNQNHSWPSLSSPPQFLKDHAETAAVPTLEICFHCRRKPSAGVAWALMRLQWVMPSYVCFGVLLLFLLFRSQINTIDVSYCCYHNYYYYQISNATEDYLLLKSLMSLICSKLDIFCWHASFVLESPCVYLLTNRECRMFAANSFRRPIGLDLTCLIALNYFKCHVSSA